MIVIVCIGLFFIFLSGLVNVLELRKFFKALGILNRCSYGFTNKLLYPFRLICLLPLLAPVIPDLILMSLGGLIGFGGGVLGGIISMGGTCFITLMIKVAMKLNRKSKDAQELDYRQAIAAL